MENTHEEPRASSPPGIVVLGHPFPIVEWEAPILSPFGGERVGLEGLFRRRAAGMLEIEDVGIAPDIRAVPADPDRDVTHQCHAFLLCMAADGQPLRVGDPLNIGVEAHEVAELPLAAGSERFDPDADGGGRAVFARPLLTSLRIRHASSRARDASRNRAASRHALVQSPRTPLDLDLSAERERNVLKAA